MADPIPCYRRYGERDDGLIVRVRERFKAPASSPLKALRWQESGAEKTLHIRIVDAQDRLIIPIDWRLRLHWSSVGNDPRNRPVIGHDRFEEAQSWGMAEATLPGITNIVDENGYWYSWWIEHEDGTVISATYQTGGYDNHTVLCPVFRKVDVV
jgi:hypothetical protein